MQTAHCGTLPPVDFDTFSTQNYVWPNLVHTFSLQLTGNKYGRLQELSATRSLN